MPYSNKKTLLLRFVFCKMPFHTEGVSDLVNLKNLLNLNAVNINPSVSVKHLRLFF